MTGLLKTGRNTICVPAWVHLFNLSLSIMICKSKSTSVACNLNSFRCIRLFSQPAPILFHFYYTRMKRKPALRSLTSFMSPYFIFAVTLHNLMVINELVATVGVKGRVSDGPTGKHKSYTILGNNFSWQCWQSCRAETCRLPARLIIVPG